MPEKCVVHEQEIHDLKQTCLRWGKLIDGNGKEPLNVRLDRLESFTSVVKWLVGAVVIETLALGANIFLYLLPKLLGH